MKLTKCPYCGKQVSYMQAFIMRNRGEFFCNKCKKESNILIKKTLLIPFIAAVIMALLILAVFMFLTPKDNLIFMLLVALPFFWFYLMTPLYIELSPRKKHMDSLYDTQIVESPVVDPDPTVASKSTVIPAFVDDVVFSDSDDPVINTEVFNAIKEERKIIEESTTSGDTKSFSKFENVSSSKNIDSTMPVQNLKDVKVNTNQNKTPRYDLNNFE